MGAALGARTSPRIAKAHVTTANSLGRILGRFSWASIVLVCGGFSACALALCLFAGWQFKHNAEEEFYRETGNIARILMASFDEDTANLDAILRQLASQLVKRDISTANEPQLHELLSQYALHPSVIVPAVIDRDGRLVASARTMPVEKLSLKDRSIFSIYAGNPHENELYISAPTLGLQTNEWSIQFSRPLRDAAGNFLGVVIASYRLSHFVDLYEKLKISDRGLAGLTGNDGIVRIRSLSGSIGYGTTVPKLALVYDRVLAGEKSGTFHGRSSVDDVVRIGTFVVSERTPFYVTVGYDEDYLRSRYIGFFTVLGICWLMLTAAMIASAVFVRSLEKIRQRAQLEVVESAIAERQNLSADMHDSIGASLAALLAHFTSNSVNPAVVKRRIGEILMELRFLVDSAEPVDGDINLVLSNVRHRMGRGLELAGIGLHWRVSELPRIAALTARDALAIKLALMEALSNVMHHSQAKSVVLTAAHDENAADVVITLADDGRGFDAGGVPHGRGMANMRKRINALSTGGTLTIETRPGAGTTIRIVLRAAPQVAAQVAAQRDKAA